VSFPGALPAGQWTPGQGFCAGDGWKTSGIYTLTIEGAGAGVLGNLTGMNGLI
jgi:hypothetical protein